MRYPHLAVVLLVAGCGHWEESRVYPATPLKPADPVLIWSSGKVEKWQAVVITRDSVSGIPYGTSVKCDSCRRSIPRALVDSMKLEYRTGGAKVVAGTSLRFAGLLAAALLLDYALCHPAKCD